MFIPFLSIFKKSNLSARQCNAHMLVSPCYHESATKNNVEHVNNRHEAIKQVIYFCELSDKTKQNCINLKYEHKFYAETEAEKVAIVDSNNKKECNDDSWVII